MDNKAYQRMDYALCLLSAAAGGKRHGCIVNSFHQVTSSFPPKFTVAVNKDHETCKAVQAAGSFTVTLLDAGWRTSSPAGRCSPTAAAAPI